MSSININPPARLTNQRHRIFYKIFSDDPAGEKARKKHLSGNDLDASEWKHIPGVAFVDENHMTYKWGNQSDQNLFTQPVIFLAAHHKVGELIVSPIKRWSNADCRPMG